MQVKCLRVLQYFPPPEDPAVARALNDVLRRIITGSEVAKNVNKNNAQHAIVFEAIALALALEADPELLTAGNNSLLSPLKTLLQTLFKERTGLISCLQQPETSFCSIPSRVARFYHPALCACSYW